MGLILIFTSYCLYKLSEIQTNYSIDDWFNKEDEVYREYTEFIRSFGDDQYFIIVIHSDSLFTATELEKVRYITVELKELPGVKEVRSLTTLVKPVKTPLIYYIKPLIPTSYENIVSIRQGILNDKILIDNFISRDGKSTVIHVHHDHNYQKAQLYYEIVKLLNKHYPQDSYVIAGDVISIKATELAKKESLKFMVIALVVMFIVLYFIFKNGTWSAAIIIVSVVSVIWAMFLFLKVGEGTINMLSGIIPLVILILSLTFSIHLVGVIMRNHSKQINKTESIYTSVKEVFIPGLLANLTTSVSILSFSLSKIESIRLFGIYTSIGITISFLLSFLFIIIIADIFWPKFKISGGSSMMTEFLISKLYFIVTKKQKFVLILLIILTLISLAGVFRLKVETDVYGFFKKSHEIRIAKEKTDSWFKGVLPFEVVFRNIPQDSVIVFAKKFISLDEKILRIDQVGTCLSIHDLFDYLSLEYTNSQRRMIPGNLSKVFYDPQEKLLRYTIKTKWINHQEVMRKVGQFKKTIQQALDISSESFYITGVSILFANLNNELVDNQIKSLLISLLVLMLLLMITFRSFFYLTVGIIPNILPVFNTLAIMGIVGIPLDVGTVLIAAVSLGVAIDDTIYFIHKYRSLKNVPVSERILITYKSLFRQLLITSVVVFLGFIVMALSSYLPIIYLGIFVSTNIALAFIYDMVVLPVLLSMKNKNS